MADLASADKLQLDQQELNLDSLAAYLLRKLPDREHSDPKGMSELVSQLSQAGYKTIGQIDDVLDRAAAAFQAYEREHPLLPRGRFTDVGVARISLSIADDNFNAVRTAAFKNPHQMEKKYKDLVPPSKRA